MTHTLSRTPGTATRPTFPRRAAWMGAAALAVDGVVGILADEQAMNDHTGGAGAVSEVAAGVAFVCCAVTLALLTPVGGWRGFLWWLGPAGLAGAGVLMIGVPLTGSEPPSWAVDLTVLPALVGTIAAAVFGTRRVWPWWTGVGVALFLPVMFTVPFNSFLMAAIWGSVALTATRSNSLK